VKSWQIIASVITYTYVKQGNWHPIHGWNAKEQIRIRRHMYARYKINTYRCKESVTFWKYTIRTKLTWSHCVMIPSYVSKMITCLQFPRQNVHNQQLNVYSVYNEKKHQQIYSTLLKL